MWLGVFLLSPGWDASPLHKTYKPGWTISPEHSIWGSVHWPLLLGYLASNIQGMTENHTQPVTQWGKPTACYRQLLHCGHPTITDKIQIPIYRGLTENDSRYYGISLFQTQNLIGYNKSWLYLVTILQMGNNNFLYLQSSWSLVWNFSLKISKML